MDDYRGFLRYPRQEARKEKSSLRIRHWHEYAGRLAEEQTVPQASRCMDCGTPCCHSYCPVHNLIPDWNLLISRQHWREAWEQLESTNNFPELTGRICPAPCESACTLSLADSPVVIKQIELAIAEHAWQEGMVTPRRCRQSRGKHVVVVGSGPAGLACAQQLVRTGYRVSVLEKADRIGGLLRYGIPDFRLEKKILDRRLQQLVEEGVRFRTGVHAGVSMDAGALSGMADAVILACGSERPRDVSVRGRTAKGIHLAMQYLTQQNHYLAGDPLDSASVIDARGKDVVVVGGGDTGCDCVGTAIRQGARSVTQVQYHSRPPQRADSLQYWPDAVPVLHLTDTEEEGCRRIWGWDTVAFEARDGRVTAVLLQRLQWCRSSTGGLVKRHRPRQQRRLAAQLVLLAIGFAHPVHRGLVEDLELELDRRGNVLAADGHYRSSRESVFACGDMRRGQSLVVWAIREGRQCARAVDQYLAGSSELPCD